MPPAAVAMPTASIFALQYRYSIVLGTDQSHPHVHLLVKCEHGFEPGKRLHIRKDALRQGREQRAANATQRQVRGQIRKPHKDAILRSILRSMRLLLGHPAGAGLHGINTPVIGKHKCNVRRRD